MIVQLGSALRRAARMAVARPRTALWALLALTCALAAIGIAALAASNVEYWTAAPARGGASMVVYLGEGVDDARAQTLTTELAKLPGVERAELVPAAETARRLQAALGMPTERDSLLDGVDLASLPASVEVTLAPGVRDVIAMSPIVSALHGTPGVDDVVVADDGPDRVAGTLGTVRVVAWGAAAVLAGLALIVVLATTRVRLDRDPQENRVLALLGASAAFTIVPTALAGAVHGIVAALLAAAGIGIALAMYGDHVVGPAIAQLALFVALGAALGSIGGGLAGASRVAS